MRLHFSLSPSREAVTFNYHRLLAGCLHKWLGPNTQHDALSLYSVGSLQGGGARQGALHFPRGATWHISAPDTEAGQEFLSQIADAALKTPPVCCGMEVIEIASQVTPDFGSRRVFRAESPIFIRGEKQGDLDPHILFDHPLSGQYLTQTLHHKLDKAGLGHLREGATMRFDHSYSSPKTRLIWVKEGFDKEGNPNGKDFQKRASVCPVIVSGDPEVVKFAFCTGAGHLTGMGLGSLI